ncbi:MAG: toxic anion resistance protein, partial [Candidatus Dormibacteraceae bacterium]
MTDPGTQTPAPSGPQELVLEPPKPVTAVTAETAATTIKVDPDTAKQIDQAVGGFVDSITGMDTHSPEFQRKVQSVSQMGNQEIRRS